MSDPNNYDYTSGDGSYTSPFSPYYAEYQTHSVETSFGINSSAIDYFVLAEDPQVAAANKRKNEANGAEHSSYTANQLAFPFTSPTKEYNAVQYQPSTSVEYIPQRVATFGGVDTEEEEDLTKSKAKTIPYVPKPLTRSKSGTELPAYVPGSAGVDDTDTPFAPYVSESEIVKDNSIVKTEKQSSSVPKVPSKSSSTDKHSSNVPKTPSKSQSISTSIKSSLPSKATLSAKDLSKPSEAIKRPSTTETFDEVPGVKSARIAHKPSYDASLVPRPVNCRVRPTRSSLRQLMAERYQKVAAEAAVASKSSSTDVQDKPVKKQKVQLNTSFDTSTIKAPLSHASTTTTSDSPKPNAPSATKLPVKIAPTLSNSSKVVTPVNRISTEPSASKSISVGLKNQIISSPSTVLVAKGKPAEVVTSKSASVSRFTVGKRDKSAARVAHVPKPISMKDAAKLGINPALILSSSNSTSSNSSLKNHQATLSKLLMPLPDASARVPLSVRRSTLLKIRAELISGIGHSADALSPEELEAKSAEAQQLEKEIASRAKSNRNIYVSLGASKVATIRREQKEAKGEAAAAMSSSSLSEKKKSSKKFRQLLSTAPATPAAKISHDALLKANAKNCSLVIRESARVADLTREELVHQLGKLIIPVEELEKYGFPRPVFGDDNDDSAVAVGKAFLPNCASVKTKPIPYVEGMSMTCRRCRAIYRNPQKVVVTDKDDPNQIKPVCVYHEGRVFKFRDRQGVEGKYTCCKGDREAGGCASATAHVTDGLEFTDAHEGFISTVPGGLSQKVAPNVFALDCEMCYTDRCLALSRVTLLNFEGNIVYDSLVKPEGVILDYNTKFSGIKEGDLDEVTTTLADVQQEIKALVAAESILIGHGLDSDFRVLKLFHEKVVDTTYLYPHRQGLPFKRSLRMLASNFLNRIIQDSEEGHDSNEDAKAALELVKLKLQEELNKFLIN